LAWHRYRVNSPKASTGLHTRWASFRCRCCLLGPDVDIALLWVFPIVGTQARRVGEGAAEPEKVLERGSKTPNRFAVGGARCLLALTAKLVALVTDLLVHSLGCVMEPGAALL
jgi:hypothetical protein